MTFAKLQTHLRVQYKDASHSIIARIPVSFYRKRFPLTFLAIIWSVAWWNQRTAEDHLSFGSTFSDLLGLFGRLFDESLLGWRRWAMHQERRKWSSLWKWAVLLQGPRKVRLRKSCLQRAVFSSRRTTWCLAKPSRSASCTSLSLSPRRIARGQTPNFLSVPPNPLLVPLEVPYTWTPLPDLRQLSPCF